MRRPWSRAAMACVALGAVLAAGACSQIAALTPVAGDAVTSVRNAATDVLVDQGVAILVAPQCSETPAGFSCAGSTVDGDEIVVVAAPDEPYELTISVGGAVIFEGTAVAVLAAAAQAGS